MINVSTDYSKANREKYLCKHGAYFSTMVMREELDDIDKKIIKEIDKAEVTDNNTIMGRYGITSLVNISKGAKILMLPFSGWWGI